MLMKHKDVWFTQIPDKTNNVIFLKSQNPVLAPFSIIFGHFCPLGIFYKKSASVKHNHIWIPNTMLSFRKN